MCYNCIDFALQKHLVIQNSKRAPIMTQPISKGMQPRIFPKEIRTRTNSNIMGALKMTQNRLIAHSGIFFSSLIKLLGINTCHNLWHATDIERGMLDVRLPRFQGIGIRRNSGIKIGNTKRDLPQPHSYHTLRLSYWTWNGESPGIPPQRDVACRKLRHQKLFLAFGY